MSVAPKSPRTLRTCVAFAALLVLESAAYPVRAQPAKADAPREVDPATLAIDKGREALAAYERGDWAAAGELFRAADRLYHSPVFVLHAARCSRNLDRLLEAQETYQSLVQETLDPSAPAPWHEAQADARTELVALSALIPRVVVDAEGSTARARVTIDGEPAQLGTPVSLDPGRHTVVLEDEGRSLSQQIELGRGEQGRRVNMVEKEERAPPGEEPDGGGLRLLGIVLTGVGAAGLVAGGVFGGLALGEASSAEDALPQSCDADRQCLASDEAAIDDSFATSRTLAGIADGLLIGGAVVATVGIVLWVTSSDEGSDVTVQATLGGAAMTGHF